MCGIVGYISLEDKKHEIAKRHFSDYALMLDTMRGYDSTGIIRVTDKFDVHTAHTTMQGREYVHTAKYDKFMQKFPSWAFIGHNRAATAGSIKLENAHPFTFGDVTMVHNGTLARKGETMPNYDHKLDVDSMQIARCLSEVEPDSKAVAELLKQIDGSFCLVWVDRRDESINMCRNSSRPMHFAFNKAKDIMWFMSDGTHLRAIAKSMTRCAGEPDTIYSLDKMKILKFKKGSMVPEVTTFLPFVPKPQPQQPKWFADGEEKYSGGALATAAKRWQANMQKHAGSCHGTSTEGTGRIAGTRRKIPNNHAQVVNNWYEMDIDTMVSFQTDTWMELKDKKCVVHGMFKHPDWAYAEWPMTLYDVPLVICTAYADRPWAVKSKGVCSSWKKYKSADDVVGMLGELYSYDAKAHVFTEDEDMEDDDPFNDDLVVGPDELLMEKKKCMSLIAKGCIQCNAAIGWEERAKCTEVNEGRDVLCPSCSDEWKVEGIG